MGNRKGETGRGFSSKEKAAYAGLGALAGAAGFGAAWMTADKANELEQNSGNDVQEELGEGSDVQEEVRVVTAQPARPAEVVVTDVQTVEEIEQAGMEVVETPDAGNTTSEIIGEDAALQEDTAQEETIQEGGSQEEPIQETPFSEETAPVDEQPLPEDAVNMESQENAGWMNEVFDHADGDVPLEYA